MMANNELVIVKGKHIIKNMEVINRHMDYIIGRVISPGLRRYLKGYQDQHLKPYPGAAKQPPEWESPAQLRMFWATKGFGRGIGAARTMKTQRSWRVETHSARKEAAIKNIASWATYLFGDEQQKMHHNTGWLKIKDHEEPVRKGALPVAKKSFEHEIRDFLFKKGLA
jgi:hypothetical protein